MAADQRTAAVVNTPPLVAELSAAGAAIADAASNSVAQEHLPGQADVAANSVVSEHCTTTAAATTTKRTSDRTDFDDGS
jgi:hypothetical protein